MQQCPNPRMFWQENIDTKTKKKTWKQRGLLPGERKAGHSARGLGHHRVPIIIQLGPGEGLTVDTKCGPTKALPRIQAQRDQRGGLEVEGGGWVPLSFL